MTALTRASVGIAAAFLVVSGVRSLPPASADPPAGEPETFAILVDGGKRLFVLGDADGLVFHDTLRPRDQPAVLRINLGVGSGEVVQAGVNRGPSPVPAAASSDGKLAVVGVRPNGIDVIRTSRPATVTRIAAGVRGMYMDDTPAVLAASAERIWAWSPGVPEFRGYSPDGKRGAGVSLQSDDYVFSAAASADGRRLYALVQTGSPVQRTVRHGLLVIDATAGKVLQRHDLGAKATQSPDQDSLALAADGSTLAVAWPAASKRSELLVVATAELERPALAARSITLPARYFRMTGVAVSADGATVATFDKGVAGAVFTHDAVKGDGVALAAFPGAAHLFDARKLQAAGAFAGKVLQPDDLRSAVRPLKITPDSAGFAPDGTAYFLAGKDVIRVAVK